MFSRIHTRNSTIMFDVGTTGVRVCQVGRRGTAYSLRDHLQLDLRPNENAEPAAEDRIDCARLARALGQGRFRGHDVGLVLSPPAVQFHTLEVPEHLLSKSEAAVREALAWEIARETRTAPEDWEVRHWAFPSGRRAGRNIMSAAISSSLVRGWISDFARHGLQLRHVTVSPCALSRVAACGFSPGERDVWGVFDIGHQRSVLTVLVASKPVYIRSIALGGADWTRRLAGVFDTSFSEAEQIKRRHGLQPGADEPEADVDDGDRARAEVCGVVFNTLRPALDELVREVNRCFLYVLESYPDLTVTQLFLAGGGANLRGLAEYLNLQLDLPTSLLSRDSLETRAAAATDARAPRVTPQWAASLGATLLALETA